MLSLYCKNSVNKQNIIPADIACIHLVTFYVPVFIFTYFAAMVSLKIMVFFMQQTLILMQKVLKPLFRHNVISMLKKRGLITETNIKLISYP